MTLSKNQDDEKVKIKIQPSKKNNSLIVVKLYHPKLILSNKLQNAFKKNRSSSLHNTLRWGLNEGYEDI
jgi:hypothetical protein